MVQQFAAKKWSDEDITSDVQFLLEKTEAKVTKEKPAAVSVFLRHLFCFR